MKLLVTGTEGYIGSLLVEELLQRGHNVTGLDTGFYRDGCLYNGVKTPAHCIHKDIRHVTEDDVRGFDAAIHLAELSNDPLGQHNPAITYQVNHLGSVGLARKCKQAGSSDLSIRRLVASMASRPSKTLLRNRQRIRKPPTRSARCWSNAISQSWPMMISRRRFCAMPRLLGRRPGCVSISC